MSDRLNIKTKLILLVLILGAGIVGISFNWFKGQFFQNQSLEQLWTAKSVTPEEFTRLYVSLLKEMIPDCRVEVIAPLELEINMAGKDSSIKSFLGNYYKESELVPQRRKETCSHYIRGFLDSSTVSTEDHSIDPNKIIPILKDRRYINNAPLDRNSEKPFICENLIADIYIIYAIDEERYLRFILPSELRDMNLPLEKLQTMAKDNLQKILPDATLLKFDKGFAVEVDHQNEAALLLLDEFWSQVEQKVDGQIIAAAPSRSMLIFTTRETDGGIARLKEIVRNVAENESYLISETLLIRHNGKWEVFAQEECQN